MKSSVVNTFLILMVVVGLAANIATASRIRGSSSSSSTSDVLNGDESISNSRSQTSDTIPDSNSSSNNRKVRQLLRENPKSALNNHEAEIFEKSASPSPLPTKGADYDPSRTATIEKNKKPHNTLKNAIESSKQHKLDIELPTNRGVGGRTPFKPTGRVENAEEDDENYVPNRKKRTHSGLLSRPQKLKKESTTTTDKKTVGDAVQEARENAEFGPPNQKIGSSSQTSFGAKAVPKKAMPSKRRWR